MINSLTTISDAFGRSTFPRLDDVKSRTLCLSFCLIIEQRAADLSASEDDIMDKIHEILVKLGIPKEEFYAVEKESSDLI
jgi:hypothetical protein